jgi:glyoxylase-like metal-dependent hydrolase (beta-lactamase superfamily II)
MVASVAMRVDEIGPGLWRWTGRHPEWGREVGCVYHEAADAICLIDPLLPREDERRFWSALDRDVERIGRPVEVLITIYWHTRDARAFAERYGGRVRAHAPARAPIERRLGLAPRLFRPGDPLPGGIEAFVARGSEVVFWLTTQRTLVTGDVILGSEAHGLELCPPSWSPRGGGPARVRDHLRALAPLPIERVLVSHGEPVVERAHAAFARLLAA